MAVPFIPSVRLAAFVVLVFGLSSLTGCDRGIRRVPVSGNVTLDGKPLHDGLLVFNPDEAKGNTMRIACTGRVKDGHYTLNTSAVTSTDTGSGAPLGWFKVTLSTDLPGMAPIKVAPKFESPQASPVAIEIVDNPQPGAYDISLTSK